MMKDKSVNIMLVEDDEVDIMNVERAFKKNHILNPLHVAGYILKPVELDNFVEAVKTLNLYWTLMELP